MTFQLGGSSREGEEKAPDGKGRLGKAILEKAGGWGGGDRSSMSLEKGDRGEIQRKIASSVEQGEPSDGHRKSMNWLTD